jgi:hypothetical protein
MNFMSKADPIRKKERFSQELLDRIDNMPTDAWNTYSAYEPVKKQNVSESEMFSDEMYDGETGETVSADDGDAKLNKIVTAVIIGIIVLCVGLVVLLKR